MTYNQELMDALQGVLASKNKTGEMVSLRADYLAERSIEDNIALESS